jgi:conjugative transfer signal peptidase TraF
MTLKKVGIRACIGGIALLCGYAYLQDSYKINWYTDSMPRGIYRIEHRIPDRGEIAVSCLTDKIIAYGRERGYFPTFKGSGCSHGLYPLAKYVYGIPGDKVELRGNDIWVNDEFSGISRLTKDSQGRAMPEFASNTFQLQESEYFLMSNHRPNSYDSRYFGAVTVIYVLKPVWSFS